jgi:hypothetical protein
VRRFCCRCVRCVFCWTELELWLIGNSWLLVQVEEIGIISRVGHRFFFPREVCNGIQVSSSERCWNLSYPMSYVSFPEWLQRSLNIFLVRPVPKTQRALLSQLPRVANVVTARSNLAVSKNASFLFELANSSHRHIVGHAEPGHLPFQCQR